MRSTGKILIPVGRFLVLGAPRGTASGARTTVRVPE